MKWMLCDSAMWMLTFIIWPTRKVWKGLWTITKMIILVLKKTCFRIAFNRIYKVGVVGVNYKSYKRSSKHNKKKEDHCPLINHWFF